MVKTTPEDPVIFFDGVCNLCNGFIQFMLRHDKSGKFYYSPLQSDAGKRILKDHPVNHKNLDSIVLLENGKVFERSEAILRIAGRLGGVYQLLLIFRILPLFVRDALYNCIARYRYRIFGKKDECMVPTPEVSQRFLME